MSQYAVKECASCHKQYEILRNTCPYCGGKDFINVVASGNEASTLLTEIEKKAEAKKHVDASASLIMQGRFADAERELKKAIEINPFNATAHGNMGGVFLRQGRTKDAIPWLEKALQLDPNIEGVSDALRQAKQQAGTGKSNVPPPDAPDDEVETSAAFLRPRRPADDEIDMTPMIDCVFLLLIFFIVNFQADQTKVVPLPVAKYGNPVLGLESVFITIAGDKETAARVYLGDQVDPSLLTKSSNAVDQEEEIVAYVKRALESGKKQVILSGAGTLTAGQVDQVVKAVGKALEGQPLHIAVTSEER